MLVRVVTLAVPPGEVEAASVLLWDLGAVAIEERDGGDEIVLVTSFDDDEHADRAVAEVRQRWWTQDAWIEDSFLDTWRTFAVAVRIGRLLVEPAWQPSAASPDDLVIRIDPGRAFGTGSHATSFLTLELASEVLQPGDRVLDVGCGSGVLSVAAAVLGAASVEAVDIDPDALTATVANARRNGVSDRVHVRGAQVETVTEMFDVVMANIQAQVLVKLANTIEQRVRPGGAVVLSGLLEDRWEPVLERYVGCELVERRARAGWVGLLLRRR